MLGATWRNRAGFWERRVLGRFQRGRKRGEALFGRLENGICRSSGMIVLMQDEMVVLMQNEMVVLMQEMK